jgi:capsular exopolysaccharide synthesis family protein
VQATKINSSEGIEGIDTEKLGTIARKNILWILAIFLISNLTAYLVIRYTKDVYESYSELKLGIKQDAPELGIKTFVEDQNLNLVSGEIEQIKSKLFFNRVLDSMELWVGYYSIGKVLNDEMYRHSPFLVDYGNFPPNYRDVPIYFNFLNQDQFSIRVGKEGEKITGVLGSPITLNGSPFTIRRSIQEQPSDENDYFFIVYSRSRLLEYLSSNIQVEPINFNASTIRISFQDNNATKTYDIVNKIDSLYLGYTSEQKNLANTQKIEWLNRELKQIETKMEGFENYFENFTLQNKSNNVDEDLRKTIYLINKVDSQRFELSKRIGDLNGLIDDLNARNYATSFTFQQFLPDYINRGLLSLQEKVQAQNRLGLAYNENTYAFRQTENELNALRNTVFLQLSTLKKNWLQKYSELNTQKDRLAREFAGMPDKSTQFSKQQRFYKLHEGLYLTMMQNKAQFEIMQAGSTPDFKILSPATLPVDPIRPKKSMILAIGLVAGIILNFFFLGILYVINNKITSVREIEKSIQVPVLGAIPESADVGDSQFQVVDNPKSMVSEAIRTLRTNLDFFATGEAKKVIAISSTISGEGKSFLALNLGGVLALSRKRVVLLNLDMRKQKATLPFTISDPSKGISTILIKKHGWRDCLTKTTMENMDYIPSGPHPPNPSELLLNGEFSLLLEELKQEYDFILLDTPPIGLVTDGTMVMKRANICIYVFRANYSKKEFLQSLQRIMNINKFNNLAIVVNAIPVSSKSAGYGYYEDRPSRKNKFKKLLNV